MALSKIKVSVVETVDDTKLLDEETDCFEITEAVSKLAAHYRQFGIGLGLLPSKVDEIERLRKTPTTVNEKFSQVVTLRLNQLPAPTWRTFIDAARLINRALAGRVEKAIPGSVDSTLKRENLRAVTDKFNGISAKYYQFGSNLKISPGVLDGIRNEISVHDLLQEVVREFLQNPREKFKPTWRTIVDAVFDINPALAKEIAEKHLATPVKSAPSSTSPLGISSSPVVESPDLPTQSSTSDRRVTTDSNDTIDESDTPLPPVSKISDHESVQAPFELCGIRELKDEPVQHISENIKQFLPRALLQLDRVTVPSGATPLNGSGVEIAILDSGIYLYHEIFRSKGGGQIEGYNFVSNDPPHSWHTKPELHGTALAAITAGNMYNSPTGPCPGGIASSAKLYVCRVYSGKETKYEWIVSALDHLIGMKQKSRDRIDIIVMSFGGPYKDIETEKRLKQLADLGVVLVASGGNSGPRPDDTFFPSSDIHVISVGALDELGGYKTNFSSTHCHIYAPGKSVYVPSVVRNSTTEVCPVDGTSFAAPILGGFLALLLQSANNSKNDDVIKKCHDINFLNTLLRDHKLVRDEKLWYAHEVLESLQNDPSYIVKLVKDQYGNQVR